MRRNAKVPPAPPRIAKAVKLIKEHQLVKSWICEDLPESDGSVGLPDGASLAGISNVLFNYAVRINLMRPADMKEPPMPDQMATDVSELFGLFASRRIPVILVGGMAMNHYIAERLTQDIDFIIANKDLKRLPEITLRSENAAFANATFKTVPVDFLFADAPFFRSIQDNFTTTLQLGQHKVSCATLEGLIAMKIYALPSLYVQGNTAKIARYEKDILYLTNADPKADIKRPLAAIEPYLSQGQMQEVRNIVAEIQQIRERQQDRLQRLKM